MVVLLSCCSVLNDAAARCMMLVQRHMRTSSKQLCTICTSSVCSLSSRYFATECHRLVRCSVYGAKTVQPRSCGHTDITDLLGLRIDCYCCNLPTVSLHDFQKLDILRIRKVLRTSSCSSASASSSACRECCIACRIAVCLCLLKSSHRNRQKEH